MKHVLLTGALLIVGLLTPSLYASQDLKTKHRLLTLTRQGQEASAYWSFQWNDERRRTLLVLKSGNGSALEVEEEVTLYPIFTITTELRSRNGDWRVELESRFPGIAVSSFRDVMLRTEPGEAIQVRLLLPTGEELYSSAIIPSDQTRGFGLLEGDKELASKLEASVPDELLVALQTLTEFSGPDRNVTDIDPITYAIAVDLLPAFNLQPNPIAWSVAEGELRHGPELSESEKEFLEISIE